MMKTIDITPTWASIIPPLVEVLKNPKAPAQVKREVTDELIRLAKIVDDQNSLAKKQKESLT
tara:strand:- start:1192 stop:1377 length:186 start_codon:yes stop_codon:yes gene_type:complete